MSWSKGIYVATKSLGVYYTGNFVSPGTQPTWAQVNTGLTNTDCLEFKLDPFDPENKQYVLINTGRTLYRRDNQGSWSAILTPADVNTLLSTSEATIHGFCTDVSIPGRLWANVGSSETSAPPNGFWAVYSDNYGESWTAIRYLNSPYTYGANVIRAHGDNIWISMTAMLYSKRWLTYSYNGGVDWSYYEDGIGGGYLCLTHNPIEPDRIYFITMESANYNIKHFDAGSMTVTNGFSDQRDDVIWFDPADADHQRSIYNIHLLVTEDRWDSYSSIDLSAEVISIARFSGGGDAMLVGMHGDDFHYVGTIDGEVGTVVGISGTNRNNSPYTDSIPETCGGICIDGVQGVKALGAVNTHAVAMPDYTGSARGVPSAGDRSAWDDVNYQDKHAKSIKDGSYDYHTPLSKYDATTAPTANDDSGDGYAPGSRWIDVTNDKAYICVDASSGAAVWVEVMERGDYDEDADGLIDAAHGGTELDSSAETGIPHISSGTWSFLKRLSPGADTELTIDTGEITVTQLYHRVDTEADAASDDLDTINGLANDGELLILHPEDDAREVILKHGTGNIYIPGGSDITLDDSSYHVLLIYDVESTNWCVVGGGSGGSGGDMTKAVYDIDENDIVDNAEKVDGVDTAGNSKYYGTDSSGTAGFHNLPAGGIVDAGDVTYTPTILSDWDGDADPGDVDNALDQLAERVDDNEGDIANKADDDTVVHDTGNETVAGEKTFSTFPKTPEEAPDANYEVANKKYVDDNSGGGDACKVKRTTNQAILNATATIINFTAEDYDTNSLHDNSTNNTRLTCKMAGIYHIFGCVRFESNATGSRIINVLKNGTDKLVSVRVESVEASGQHTTTTLSTDDELALNDYVELQVWQNSGGTLDIEVLTGSAPKFGMTYQRSPTA